jgi:hypothetical protein
MIWAVLLANVLDEGVVAVSVYMWLFGLALDVVLRLGIGGLFYRCFPPLELAYVK